MLLKGIKPMNIQELNMENIEEIKRLMVAIFSGEPWNDSWTDGQLHAYISQLIGNQNSLSFGVYRDGALIGLALGKIKSWYEGTEYWVDEFGILPEMQQSGIGSAFIREIEKTLATRGISYIVLLTEKNLPAYDFYKKNGFEEKEETVFFAKAID